MIIITYTALYPAKNYELAVLYIINNKIMTIRREIKDRKRKAFINTEAFHTQPLTI